MSTIVVNVVSKVPAAVWAREVSECSRVRFLHSRHPIDADFHVVYGIRDRLVIPNYRNRTIFVASEPPEIREYNLSTLRRYGSVIGADYPYLRSLKNFSPQSGLAPWWLGVDGSTRVHYEAVGGSVGPSISELKAFSNTEGEGITAIVSEKSRTPLQQQRLRLIEYLSKKIPELRVLGRGSVAFGDKGAVLRGSAFHLAVENSIHPRYWTEKLSDPVLMSNYVFYGGHKSISDDLSEPGILMVNPWEEESVYRQILEKLAVGISENDRIGIQRNKNTIISRLNFHCTVERIVLESLSARPSGKFRVTLRPQNRQPMHRRVVNIFQGTSFGR